MPGSSDSVKVAVRVRPFNQREEKAESACILYMKDKTTVITNPETGDKKTFSYDHSYWSHSGYTETAEGVYEPDSPQSTYADQKRLFSDLGKGVLDNAWQGYNAALFAYGQTGSGKSYSMIGYGKNKGIVPITCEELFNAIEGKKDNKKQLRVTFSMLEIYNEQVRDLLVKAKPPQGGLKVRQNPKTGFYVEGLKQVPVRNYGEIEQLMESGTINRTTASTNMNATSSRSHMVITIKFEQVIVSDTGQSNTRSSDINLVDLAGSERADTSGATGDRLKEGSAINQSLSTLGNVISALADQAMGKKRVMVPYRDSVLTKLLQSALGGNSRTIMIAALSPADINYEETLSTLRYADRAKKIQNKAVVNENPTERLIRELKEENARLLAMLKKQGGGDTAGGEEEDDIQRMLEENQKRMGDMQMSWEERLEDARKEWERSQHVDVGGGRLKLKQNPYITNINEDPQLSGVIKHCICKGCTVIGRAGSSNVTVEIRGLGIQATHAELSSDGKHVHIKPSSDAAQVIINGIKVRDKTKLSHLDRIKLGSNSLFLYVGFPKERGDESQLLQYDFDYFMTELAEHDGVSVDITTPRTSETADVHNKVLFQDFVDLMPKITEANAISDELKKNVKFELQVKSESSHEPTGKALGKEVIVRVTQTKTRKVYIWSKVKFLNRKDLMDELYLRHLDGDSVIQTRDKDPFWDPVEDVFLGSCHVMLKSLGYCAEIDEHFTLHNYHGKEEAVIRVQILPCDVKGNLMDDDFIMEPSELLGKTLNFFCIVPECMSVRFITEDHSRGVYCRFSLPYQEPMRTKDIWHKGYAEFDFKKQLTYKTVTKDLLEFFHSSSLVIELWGKQVSEDTQLHGSNGHSNKEDGGDLLAQLRDRETEVETLSQECEALRKDNFRLKQTSMKTEEKLKLMEIRRENTLIRKNSRDKMNQNPGSKPSSERRPVGDNRGSLSAVPPPKPPAGLDVEMAKALRDFFRDVRDIQSGLNEMKNHVGALKEKVGGNGLRSSVEAHEMKIITTDEKLADCVTALKKSAAIALKKSK